MTYSKIKFPTMDELRSQPVTKDDAITTLFNENEQWLIDMNNCLLNLAYQGKALELHELAGAIVGVIKIANQGCRMTIERMAAEGRR